VRLDDPWKGKEIGIVTVSATAPQKAMTYGVDVPDVEGLTGKHAIYLVAEGPEVKQPEQPQGRPQWGRRPQEPQRPQGLFDLHGIGFAKNGSDANPTLVPQLTITVDGQQLNIPGKPILATNANGYMEANHYQLYAARKAGPKIEDKASDPNVLVNIITGKEYRATVIATYNGKEKVFLIN
jgi:hypothetical protein